MWYLLCLLVCLPVHFLWLWHGQCSRSTEVFAAKECVWLCQCVSFRAAHPRPHLLQYLLWCGFWSGQGLETNQVCSSCLLSSTALCRTFDAYLYPLLTLTLYMGQKSRYIITSKHAVKEDWAGTYFQLPQTPAPGCCSWSWNPPSTRIE